MIVVNVRTEQIQLEHESNFYYYTMFKLQVNVSRCQHDNDRSAGELFCRRRILRRKDSSRFCTLRSCLLGSCACTFIIEQNS